MLLQRSPNIVTIKSEDNLNPDAKHENTINTCCYCLSRYLGCVCLATVKSEPTYCYSIRDRDFQNFCLAQVKGEKTYCYSIQDRDAQQQCLSQF